MTSSMNKRSEWLNFKGLTLKWEKYVKQHDETYSGCRLRKKFMCTQLKSQPGIFGKLQTSEKKSMP